MTVQLGGARLGSYLRYLSATPPQLSLGESHRPPRGEAPNPPTRVTMTTRIQLSLFPGPGDGLDPSQGIFVPEVHIIPPTPKPPTDAAKKRHKRRAWYVQASFKKNSSDGPPVA